MLTTILLAIAAVIAAILIFASTKPNSFRISRSATINARPESIFPLVNELRAHRAWSPFDQDAGMRRSYSGPESGKGAMMQFDGGNKTGVGSISITDVVAPSKILMNLIMTKPMKCNNTVEFTFEPKDGATQVTWAMYGPQPYIGKLMNVFIDCNKMCERQFDAGLAKLKAIAEGDRIRPAA
ncbi:MAG: SRPBCC family protein [Pseudorhodoplanes sp.]|jgi:uncharacterized protein YndB with AHSA1/START domain|nr:SRPBCC family protein [Pseudorhodoplanes sp.]